MTVYRDFFEDIVSNAWARRNPSTDSYSIADRWEAAAPDYGASQQGSLNLVKKTSPKDFDDPIELDITGSQEFDLYFYVGASYSGETQQPTLTCDVFLDDGSSGSGTPSFQTVDDLTINLFGIAIEYDFESSVANHTVSLIYRENGGTVTTLYSFNPTEAQMPLSSDDTLWFGFRLIVTSSQIKLYHDFGDVGIWTHQTTIVNSSYITSDLDKLVINLSSWQTGEASNERARLDNLRLGIGVDIQSIDTNVQGLSLGTAEVIGLNCWHLPGAGGYADITIQDKHLANWATLLTNHNKEIVIVESAYETPFLVGEVKVIEQIGLHGVLMRAFHNSSKTLRIKCNYNPVIYADYLKYVNDDEIEDRINNLSTIGTSDVITFEKVDSKSIKLYPTSMTINSDATPSGDVEDLHDPNTVVDQGAHNTNYNENCFFFFQLYCTDRDDITAIKAHIEFTILGENGGYDNITYWEMRENGGSYLPIDTIPAGGGDGEDDEPLSYTFDVDYEPQGVAINEVPEVINDTPNSSGYKEYLLTIRFRPGKRDTGNQLHQMTANIIHVTVEFDTDQPVTVGQADVTAASGTDEVTFDNSTPSWALANMPLSEGFGAGDLYFVTKYLDTILTNIFAAIDSNIGLNEDITDIGNHVLFTRDLTYDLLHIILDEVKNLLNAPWWLNPATRQIDIISVDNLSSTSLTLTRADFVGDISYRSDSSNIRSRITIVGKNDISSVAVTEEYEHEAGGEEEVIVDPDLTNSAAINSESSNRVKRHQNASVSLVGTLNYSNPEQNYSPIALYKTVAISLDDGTGTEIVSHTDPELAIVKIQHKNNEKTGFQDFVTIWCEELIE